MTHKGEGREGEDRTDHHAEIRESAHSWDGPLPTCDRCVEQVATCFCRACLGFYCDQCAPAHKHGNEFEGERARRLAAAGVMEIVLLPRPLIETNPYLRDPEMRDRLLRDDTYQSSVFEGAVGLIRPDELEA